MDSVSHPTNVVMKTGSVLMAVMKSTAVHLKHAYITSYVLCTLWLECFHNRNKKQKLKDSVSVFLGFV